MHPRTRLYSRARAGDEPAEALSQRDRRRLVAELHALGWTLAEIAEHTMQTTHTTARILNDWRRAQHAREAHAA